MSERLAIFMRGLGGGGAERMMLHLSRGFAEAGLATDFILARDDGVLVKHIPGRVRRVVLHTPRIRQTLPALTQYLRRERPRWLLSSLEFGNLLAVAARGLARVPTAVFIRQANHFSSEKRHPVTWQHWVAHRVCPPVYRRATGVIALSRGVAEDLADSVGVPPQRIRTIHNPALTPELLNRNGPPNHPWLERGDAPVVLATGRLCEQKGFDTLLQAFAQVRARRRARLLILGEGAWRQRLERLAVELGVAEDVDLPGFCDDPFSAMRHADVFVLSSRWEGFGNVVVEALAAGVPVVSTDCPSGPREILDDGRYGQLVPVDAVAPMAEAIDRVLAGVGSSEAGRQRAEDFRYDRVAAQYLDYFREVT